jgi:hypothetical protein
MNVHLMSSPNWKMIRRKQSTVVVQHFARWSFALTVVVVYVALNGTFNNSVLALSLSNRKQFVKLVMGCGGIAASGALSASNAACLPGDLNPDCIGVYKVPLDDCLRDMFSTKESLKVFAPDLNYVPPMSAPQSSKAALEMIRAQRLAVDDIVTVVSAGRLEEAGIKVLNLLPRLTLSGRVLVEAAYGADVNAVNAIEVAGAESIQDLRRQKAKSLLAAAEVAWNDVDIMIGQGLRGNLGVSAVAQLLVLAEIRQATAALDDFMTAVSSGGANG